VVQGRTAVVAIGGNSLINDKTHQTISDQYIAARETCRHIVTMIKDGWTVVITHGNGPQVGFMLRRSELAAHELRKLPLDVCGAHTQGAIGYALQQSLVNEFRRYGVDRDAATVICQTEVAPDDPAFGSPTKPIGSFMDAAQAERRRREDGWVLVEDANRGYRRVVASPRPLRIVELPAIRKLVAAGTIVITAGGGGVPVVAGPGGELAGVPAVIDKDLASSLLASNLDADLLLITTGVEKVALNFGTPQQRWADRLTLSEARAYLAAGTHFARGSMAPKIQAMIEYLERGGTEGIITDTVNIDRALSGATGTRITRDLLRPIRPMAA
jgi:carbamate kinase